QQPQPQPQQQGQLPNYRNLTTDQLQNIYKRLQQLKYQHGQGFNQLPEYTELATILTQYVQYQKQLQAQGNRPQTQTSQPQSQQTQRPFSGVHQNQGQISQPEQQHESVPTAQGQPSNVFSPQQSQLLKYQIAAFKKFIQNQPVTGDIANVINISFQQFSRHQHLQQQFGGVQNDTNGAVQGQQIPGPLGNGPTRQPSSGLTTTPGVPASGKMKTQDLMIGIPGQQLPSQMMQHHIGMPTSNPNPTKAMKQEVPRLTFARSLPPHPPIPLSEATAKYPDTQNIISSQDPLCVVDSYSNVDIPDVSFDFFNSPKSTIITPSLYPKPFDIVGAKNTKELIQALRVDQELNELAQLKEKNPSYIVDYEALKLLPFQKAVRGHVLGCVYHQNMLLNNHLPNFSAKSRTINANDASVTHALYTQQRSMTMLSKKNKIIERQTMILNASNDYKKLVTSRKDKYQRLARNVVNFHAQTEKEDQRRIERNAKQRLQALKANDEEAYIKLLDQTKDTRITHLLRQTNAFLDSLTQAVKDQQKETEGRLMESGHNAGDDETTEAVAAVEGEEDDGENVDYYSVAHKIKENIEKQPSILVGGTLKEYQIRGLEWMVSLFNNHLNGILADEMGLGKTIQTISLLTYIYETKKIKGPFLVIVPLSTLPNWNLEFDKWAPSLKKISYKGSPQFRKDLALDVKSGNFDILLTTYEYIIKDKALLSKIKWVHMIIDEGHRMKNAKSKLSYTLTEYYHSDYRLILTGTPLQNNLPELWALLNFVLPKIFNSVKSFDEWFNTPFANAGSQDKIELSEEETLLVIRRLHKVLRPFLLRRLKKDVEKSLPNKVEKVIKCKKSALQSKLYHQMLKYNQLFIGDSENKAPVGIKGMNNKLMQLRKICNHPFVFPAIEDLINPTHANNEDIWRVSGKFELLDRILPKFQASGHRVLMFFQMTQIMDIMEDFLRLRGMHYMRLDGDTKADDRTLLLRDFNAESSPYFVFLLSTRAGGLGLNLQTADTVIIFDTDWNPHQDLQAQDRAHRIGQKNEVRILRLITDDSIEEYILERAHQKLDIDGKVIQAGKFDQKSTSEEQEALLRQLLESEEGEKDEDEELDDNELNEILARDDNELALFIEMDKTRNDASRSTPRLYSEAELPEIYHQEPQIVEEVEDMNNYGRGARERKVTHYDENLTEDQWLKEINGYASEDDEEGGSVRKRKRSKKMKIEADDYQLGIEATNANDEDDDEDYGMKRFKASPSSSVGGSTANSSTAVTPSAISGVPVSRGRGRKRRTRGIPVSTPICRDLDNSPAAPNDEEREKLQIHLQQILDHMITFTNAVGRKLSSIFTVKPVRRIYPDYYVIIKNPIAFDGIKRRVQSEVYLNLEEFLYDLHLMFANARIYNQEGSVIYNDSLEMETAAMKMYSDLTGGKTIDFGPFDEKFGLIR
ncbi:hypothetical protein CANARDRAFT_179611, partial [[Candida] arabinofermentans NRRL YB-2248]